MSTYGAPRGGGGTLPHECVVMATPTAAASASQLGRTETWDGATISGYNSDKVLDEALHEELNELG
jgi:hypothetical protein